MPSSNNVLRFKQKKNFNIGIAIFLVILIYIIICIFLGLKEKPTTGYQVKYGSLSQNKTYSGIALRKEVTVNSETSGYVNYFIAEGERAAYNNLIYCIDQSGKFSDLLGEDPAKDTTLEKGELNSLKQEIKLFSKTFDKENFPEAYYFNKKIDGEILTLSNKRILDNVNSVNEISTTDVIDYSYSKDPGIVLYYQDGFENKTAADLNTLDFDRDSYKKTALYNDELVEAGSFVYKYVFDENWSIAILVKNEDVPEITANEYVEVKFLEPKTTSWGRVSIANTFEEYSVIELSFTNSMVSFAKDRFIDIELLLENESGLKVPKSSLVEKDFYLIDKEFVSKGGNSNNLGVNRKESDGVNETVKFIEIEIYGEAEGYYYVDKSALPAGSVLIKSNAPIGSTDDNTFIVRDDFHGTLTGVYNINKGYADFKEVFVLYENEEYCIVKANDQYGLNAYDYIALEAGKISDKDFVY